MNHSILTRSAGAVLAVIAATTCAPARADLVLLGSDYLQTVQPTNFVPLGSANPLQGLPVGPGATDTIVQRRGNCDLGLGGLGINGASCTVPIELVALSLVSVGNPMVRLRESPTLQSTGQMTIRSDGSGTGGTFDSFFDIFFEISLDGGGIWNAQGPLTMTSSGTTWSTIEQGMLVSGLVGDQAANRHTDKGGPPGCPVGPCVDLYIVGTIHEQHPGVGEHSARAVPEPATPALVALALVAAGAGTASRRRPGLAARSL